MSYEDFLKESIKDNMDMVKSKDPKGTLKDKCMGYGNKYFEYRNEQSDNNYKMRHPNTQGDIFDKINNKITAGLYFADDHLGTKMVGHGIATAGRVARSNYEQYYQKSPYNDPYEKGWDAFQKATNIDY